MKFLYSVDHTNPTNLDEKHIGLFQTYEASCSAIEKVKVTQGFKEFPLDFRIICIPYLSSEEEIPEVIYGIAKEYDIWDFERADLIALFLRRKEALSYVRSLPRRKWEKIWVYRYTVGILSWEDWFISAEEAIRGFEN